MQISYKLLKEDSIFAISKDFQLHNVIIIARMYYINPLLPIGHYNLRMAKISILKWGGIILKNPMSAKSMSW